MSKTDIISALVNLGEERMSLEQVMLSVISDVR